MTTPQVSTAPAGNERMRPGHAQLARVGNESEFVCFQFNPEKITVGHAPDQKAQNRSMGRPDSSSPGKVYVSSPDEAIVNAGEVSISFESLTFDGAYVSKDCTQLLEWTYPIPDTNPDPMPRKSPQVGGKSVPPPVPARTGGVKPATDTGPLPPPMVLPLLVFMWGQFNPGTKFLGGANRPCCT